MSRCRSARRPLHELPAHLQPDRNISREETAALIGISPKTLDQGIYGDPKRGIAPWAPKSFHIGRRRLWRLKVVLRWLDQQAKAAG